VPPPFTATAGVSAAPHRSPPNTARPSAECSREAKATRVAGSSRYHCRKSATVTAAALPALTARAMPTPVWLAWLRNDDVVRSEEHTSELQSPCNIVCRLLLAKKTHDYWTHRFGRDAKVIGRT